MDDGITEEIQAFDHLYQVQTEVVADDPPTLRTSVFDAGRIIAVREKTIEEGADVGDSLEEHHRLVVDGLVKRSCAEGPAEGGTATTGGVSSRRTAARTAESGGAPDVPPVPEEPALVDGLRVRQLYGELRRRLFRIGEGPADGRLEEAERVLRWIVAHPLFPRIRLDEQLRFHRLLDDLADSGGRDESAERWDEVRDFVAYLNLINHRGDLVAFDRDLLGWLDRAIEARGVDPSTLTPMRWIFGRDDDLDRLLEEVATTDREVWLGEIRRVRASLDPT